MSIYISSNAKKWQKIKSICKKYQELPPNIVKQIIDYELSKDKMTIHQAFTEYRCLAHEQKCIEDAINRVVRGREINDNPYIYYAIIFVDLEDDMLSYKTTVGEALKRLRWLMYTKHMIIRDARVNYVTQPFQKRTNI
jgi:hypothetical protein